MTAELFPPADLAGTAAAYTYFIQGVHGGPVKIGRSTDAAARLRSLQTGNPTPLRVVGTSAIPEREMHRRFAVHRLHGEFFRPVRMMLEFAALLVGPYADDSDDAANCDIKVVEPVVVEPVTVKPVAGKALDPMLDYQQVADRLSVTVRTVQTLVYSGSLRSLRVGARRRIPQSEVDRFIAAGLAAAQQEEGR